MYAFNDSSQGISYIQKLAVLWGMLLTVVFKDRLLIQISLDN